MSVIRVAPFVVPEGPRLHVALRVIRALVIIALVVSLPYLVEPFRLNQLTQACIYAIVIVGLNLLSGFGGQISLGHAGFFGWVPIRRACSLRDTVCRQPCPSWLVLRCASSSVQ